MYYDLKLNVYLLGLIVSCSIAGSLLADRHPWLFILFVLVGTGFYCGVNSRWEIKGK